MSQVKALHNPERQARPKQLQQREKCERNRKVRYPICACRDTRRKTANLQRVDLGNKKPEDRSNTNGIRCDVKHQNNNCGPGMSMLHSRLRAILNSPPSYSMKYWF